MSLNIGTGTEIQVDSANVLYNITREAEANTVTLENIKLEPNATATVTLTGAAGSTANTVDDTTANAVTYKFGTAQTFVINGDADGVKFTVDANGLVTEIDGLAKDATIDVTTSTAIKFNKNTDAFTADEINGKTVVGIKDGDNAAVVYDGNAIVIAFNGSAINIYPVQDDGAILFNDPIPNADTYATYANGVITLAERMKPSDSVKIVVTSTSPVTVQNGNSTVYIPGLAISTANTGLQITDNGALTLITTSGSQLNNATAENVQNLSGTISIPANGVLTLTNGYTITAGASGEADLTFDSGNVDIDGNDVAIATAPENTEITVAASVDDANNYSYTIGKKTYAITADSTFVADSAGDPVIEDGTVIVSDTALTSTQGDSLSYTAGTDATDGVKVTAAKGYISNIEDIEVGESFTLNNETYTMTQAGLIRGNYIWVDLVTAGTDGTYSFTKSDLIQDYNWIKFVAAPEGALTIPGNIAAEDTELRVIDSATAPTTRYGTLNQANGEFTFLRDGSDPTDAALASVTVTDAVFSVTQTITAPITATTESGSTANFNVNSTFTVDATGENVTISGPTSVTLNSGKLDIPEGISVTAGNTVVPSDNKNNVLVSEVSSKEFNITNGTATVSTVDLANETVQYEIGSWTFTIAGDNENTDNTGVTFAITNGSVTAVENLDINATMNVTGTAGASLTVNGQSFTLDTNGKLNVVGTGPNFNGQSAEEILTDTSYHIVYDGSVLGLFVINTDGTISTDKITNSVVGRYVEVTDSAINIKNNGWMPSDDNVIVVTNTSGKDLAVTKGDTTFLTVLNGVSVQLLSANSFKTVSTEGDKLADTKPTSGKVGVPANMTLTISDVEVKTTDITTVEFKENAIAFTSTDGGASITGEGTFELVATEPTTYTLNGNDVEVLATANVTATATTGTLTLNSGSLKVTDTVNTADGETLTALQFLSATTAKLLQSATLKTV